MTQAALNQLYESHVGKVSDKWEIYLDEYDRILKEYRDQPVNILEIGIQNGGSLEIWNRYFNDAKNIIGCDINPDCAKLTYADPRIRVIVGDANTNDTYSSIIAEASSFDIVIEDGSHLSGDIIKSFCLYFPVLKEGGTFIVEDLHCSYWSAFEGGLFHPYSSISFFKLLADVVNFEHWGISDRDRFSLLSGILTHYGCEISTTALAEIRSVEFINSICVIRKQPASSNSLGRRIIAGQHELVVQGHESLHRNLFRPDQVPRQQDNAWSVRALPPAETIEQTEIALQASQTALQASQDALQASQDALQGSQDALQASQSAFHASQDALTSCEHEVLNLQHALTSANKSIAAAEAKSTALLQSKSWRFTAPIRWLVRGAKDLLR